MRMSETARSARAAVFAICALAVVIGATIASAAANTPFASPLVVDLTDYRGGSVYAWLQSKGFQMQHDAADPRKVALGADARGLAVQTLRPALGLLTNNRMYPGAYSTIEIEWSVAQHPAGASYERRVNNEAIMVHVFFGSAKKSSGSMFAPNLPAFIGLFLCNEDRVGHPYVGRYYKEAGRYVCVDRAQPQRSIMTRYDLKQGFRNAFGADLREGVTGFAVEVDTSSSKGPSLAHIRRIAFLP